MISIFIIFNDIFFWIIFGFFHSLLAADFLKDMSPLKGKGYRILYNSIATFLFLLAVYFSPKVTPILLDILKISIYKLFIVLFLIALGAIIFTFGIMNWDLPGFIGLKADNGPLNTKGIYSFSRHPVYTGILIMLSSLLVIEISNSTIALCLGIGGYFIIGTIPEELKLNRIFVNYKDYRKNVGRFFPYRLRHFQYFKNNVNSK